MSDSDSSDDEGIPSISALVHSLVPNAPDDTDDDSDSDVGGGADAVGKLPSSISNLVQNLVKQYDSISDDSDSGNSSSDDDDHENKAKLVTARVPVFEDGNSDDEDDDDAGLSHLVQNILKQRAHRESVDVNSRLGPISMNIPKSSPKPSPKKIDNKQLPVKSSDKTVEPLISPVKATNSLVQSILKQQAHRDSVDINSRLGPISMNIPKSSPKPAPTEIDNKQSPATASHQRARSSSGRDQLRTSRHSTGLKNSLHSLPEHEAIASPLPSNPVRKTTTPSGRRRRSNNRSNPSELNETSHTVISAASTDSTFDAAELENALDNRRFHDDDNTETSSSIPQDSFSSFDEFASSYSTKENSKRSRKKRMKSAKPSKSSSSKASSSKASSKASSKDKSKSRRSKSSRRELKKEPLSPLLGKMFADSPRGEKDDILSPLALETPLKKKKKKKSSKAMKSESERSGSRSKRSRSSLTGSLQKLSSKPESEGKEGKASPDRSSSRRSKKDSIPPTAVAQKYDKSSRSQRTQHSGDLLSPPKTKQRTGRRSVSAVRPEAATPTKQSSKKDQPSKVSSDKANPKRRQSRTQSTQKTASTKQSKTKETKENPTDDPPENVISPKQSSTKDTNETPADNQRKPVASSDFVDPPGNDNLLSPGQESDKFSTRRADEPEEEYEEVEYERPLHPNGPINMISFSIRGDLPLLDDDTSISISSSEEEDEYETESSEGEGEQKTEYGTDVSESQIPQSPTNDSAQMQSVVPSSEAGYETDPPNASTAGSKDIGNDYEEYQSDESSSGRKFGDEDAEDNVSIGDEFESDNSASFVEDETVEEPPKQSGRRTMLHRSVKQSDLSLDDYESDSDEESIEEPPKRTGRRALLERSVSSADLTEVLDEYELESDSNDGENDGNSDSFVEEDQEPPQRTGRRTMLNRSEKQADLSLDDYESESEGELYEEPPKRTGRRALLERSVSSEDLTAVLDEYELDSDSNGENSVNSDNEDSRDQSDGESESEYEQKRKGARERESWPAPGSNPRKALPLSDGSSSVDYTDGSVSIGLDNQDYEASSDDEPRTPKERSNRRNFVDENDSDFSGDDEFDFQDDYNGIGVSSDNEASDESDAYSAGVDSVEDRNYYAKLGAVTRREDQLALRSQRLRRRVYLAVGTMFVVIIAVIILFIVDPLGKDVLGGGGRRLRGRPKIQ